jgi:hypothetical protein
VGQEGLELCLLVAARAPLRLPSVSSAGGPLDLGRRCRVRVERREVVLALRERGCRRSVEVGR